MLVLLLLAPLCWSGSQGFDPSLTRKKRLAPERSFATSRIRTRILCNVLSETQENDMKQRRFMYMTAEQDQLLKEKGDYEESLMRKPVPLKAHKVRGGSGGFGASGQSKGKTKKDVPNNELSNSATISSYAKALAMDGIVRIDNVLSAPVADALRDYLVDLRARATAQIEAGEILDTQERFADVLLNQNRCDLKIPLGPPAVHAALHDLLEESVVGNVIEFVYDSYGGRGNQATLWELNCFMSNAGARRQLVHADIVCLEPVEGLQQPAEPIMLTCFVALQDTDKTMGPTVWMPGTHTIQAHNQFFETGVDEVSTKTDSYSPKDHILQSSKAVVGTIPKGSCVIFDPRVLHCAGANTCPDPSKTRALFYVSFKNPKVDSPGCPSTSGYGIATAELTLQDLVHDLNAARDGDVPRRLQLLSHSP